ncbi:MAG: UvrD-helicase domain-containing protein [Propionibacteriaceae bacterium]|nr:UvrD-helicase domain-containing protein [Propionibacteriaceae bacterium]
MSEPTKRTAPLQQPHTIPFDPTGSLPTGAVVLEASAGTGKTYVLAALATRYIAEGVTTLPNLLLVTFTRTTTGELRSRVYDRLLQSRSALNNALNTGVLPSDALDRLLATGTSHKVRERLTRIDDALADIDRAAIATIHKFARRMLTELGAIAEHNPFDSFVEDLSNLKHQVAADSYLINADLMDTLRLSYNDFSLLTTRVLENNSVPLTTNDTADPLLAVLTAARAEYGRRKHDLHSYGYNDIMERLSNTLLGDNAERAAVLLSQRFPVVLVDEFQDTDPEQWDILQRAFLGRSTLVLIGDPKQAIYRFRGADVFAYLEAVQTAKQVYTLPVNYRADEPLVSAISQLFAQANLGTPEQPISVPPVTAYHHEPRLRAVANSPLPLLPAVELRVIDTPKPLPVATARERINNDLCTVVIDLLTRCRLQRDAVSTPLIPSDIAVLVSRNQRAEEIRDALTSAGVAAAIVSGTQSVLLSDAALAWLTLLETISNATPGRVARLALSPLVGLSAAAISDNPELLVDLRAGLATATANFPTSGVTGLLDWLRTSYDLTSRIMSLPGGERMLTDIRHVAEILGTLPLHSSATDLVNWLNYQLQNERRADSEDRSRRLETGRRAVQILTVHAAKGLEFPVVLLPEAADLHHDTRRNTDPGIIIHRGSQRLLDISPTPTPAVTAMFRAEERADTLRKLYVAATRASSRLVMWWAATPKNLTESGLQLLLSGSNAATMLRPDTSRLSPELFTVTVVPDSKPPIAESTPPITQLLTARTFTSRIDHTWTRTSYSGLSAGLHESFSDLDEPLLTDLEPSEPNPHSYSADLASQQPLTTTSDNTANSLTSEQLLSPLGDMPAGTLFGTIVHEALEHLDPTAPDMELRLNELCQRFAAENPLNGLIPESLAAGLLQVLHTPLGTLAPGRTLADFGVQHRLAELSFEMSLGFTSADAALPTALTSSNASLSNTAATPPEMVNITEHPLVAATARSVADLAALFDDPALLAPTDLLQPYGRLLANTPAAARVLSGFLTGSIDVVLRLNAAEFVIIDYKTNRFPTPDGRQLLVTDYSPSAMAHAMMQAHYPLQALLYAVALRRQLTRRLPDKNPDTLLAGVGYLFVRGMAGATTPLSNGNPYGVFVWKPSAALISAASEVLGGGV